MANIVKIRFEFFYVLIMNYAINSLIKLLTIASKIPSIVKRRDTSIINTVRDNLLANYASLAIAR